MSNVLQCPSCTFLVILTTTRDLFRARARQLLPLLPAYRNSQAFDGALLYIALPQTKAMLRFSSRIRRQNQVGVPPLSKALHQVPNAAACYIIRRRAAVLRLAKCVYKTFHRSVHRSTMPIAKWTSPRGFHCPPPHGSGTSREQR